MKICMVSTDFLPNIGGIAQHIFELSHALKKLGHSVKIITIERSSDPRRLGKEPFLENVQGLETWRIPYVLNTRIRFLSGQITSRLSSTKFAKHFLKILELEKPDVVHAHGIETRANPLSKWTSSARVWTNHTTIFLDRFKDSKNHTKLRQDPALADQVIAASEELAQKTIALGISPSQVHFISNGVDPARFGHSCSTEEWKERLDLRNERLVLCPRQLQIKNGVSYFVKAARILIEKGIKDVRFAVAGDFKGDRLEDETVVVEKLVRESYPDRIQLLGRVQNVEMPGLYALASLIVIPSFLEATSISALEAMAASKPIVASGIGGLLYLVEHEKNGLLVSPGDSRQLADAIERLLLHPSLAEQYGQVGRQRVELEFNWVQIAKRTMEVYNCAIKTFNKKVLS